LGYVYVLKMLIVVISSICSLTTPYDSKRCIISSVVFNVTPCYLCILNETILLQLLTCSALFTSD